MKVLDSTVILSVSCQSGTDPGVEIGGGHMASAEREPIMGVWGLCPSGVQGQSPWSGGKAPLKLNAFGVVICLKWR